VSLINLHASVCLWLVGSARSRSRSRAVEDDDDGVPVFSREPEPVYYITRSRPVIITCVASPAVQINFKCADQWVSPSDQSTRDIVDRETGRHGLQVSVEVWRTDIEELLDRRGGYWCECHAWNSLPQHTQPITASTNRTVVIAACEYRRQYSVYVFPLSDFFPIHCQLFV